MTSFDDMVSSIAGRKSPVSADTLEIESGWDEKPLGSPFSRKPRRTSIDEGARQLQAPQVPPTTSRKHSANRRVSIGSGTVPLATHRIDNSLHSSNTHGSSRRSRRTCFDEVSPSSSHSRVSKTQRRRSSIGGGSSHGKQGEEGESSHRRTSQSCRQQRITDGYESAQQMDWGHTTTEVHGNSGNPYGYDDEGVVKASPRHRAGSTNSQTCPRRKTRRNSVGTGNSRHRRSSSFERILLSSAYGYKVTAEPTTLSPCPKAFAKTSAAGKTNPLAPSSHRNNDNSNSARAALLRRASTGHAPSDTIPPVDDDTRRRDAVMHRRASLTRMIERPTHFLKKQESTRTHLSAFSSTGWTVTSEDSSSSSSACFSSTGWSVDGGNDVLGVKSTKVTAAPRRGRRPVTVNDE